MAQCLVGGECPRQWGFALRFSYIQAFVLDVSQVICGFPREENHEEIEQGGDAFCIRRTCRPDGRFCSGEDHR
jgi:hypothetical protein